jgi:hypothetical protein
MVASGISVRALETTPAVLCVPRPPLVAGMLCAFWTSDDRWPPDIEVCDVVTICWVVELLYSYQFLLLES